MASVYRNALTSQSQLRTVTARTWLDHSRWHSLPDALSKHAQANVQYPDIFIPSNRKLWLLVLSNTPVAEIEGGLTDGYRLGTASTLTAATPSAKPVQSRFARVCLDNADDDVALDELARPREDVENSASQSWPEVACGNFDMATSMRSSRRCDSYLSSVRA
jgi:hypothetical protein